MYSICRIMKLHGSDITASENHCERKNEVKNADKSLSSLNEKRDYYTDFGERLTEKIDNYIEGFKIKTPRKDSVKCVELMLAAPPELFNHKPREGLDKDPIFNAWKDANFEFIRREFKVDSKEPIISFYVHLDESTPHIHAHVIPIHYNESKRVIELNAKAKFGGAEKMQAFQDRYHKILNSEFQLNLKFKGFDGSSITFDRGESKELTGRQHNKIKDYYKAIERASKLGVTPEQIDKLIEREFPKSQEVSPSKIFDSDINERSKGLDFGR